MSSPRTNKSHFSRETGSSCFLRKVCSVSCFFILKHLISLLLSLLLSYETLSKKGPIARSSKDCFSTMKDRRYNSSSAQLHNFRNKTKEMNFTRQNTRTNNRRSMVSSQDHTRSESPHTPVSRLQPELKPKKAPILKRTTEADGEEWQTRSRTNIVRTSEL